MSLVEFVGRKRGRLFVALSFFSFFNARLVVCLSILAAPSMGMMGGGLCSQLKEFRQKNEIKADYLSPFTLVTSFLSHFLLL